LVNEEPLQPSTFTGLVELYKKIWPNDQTPALETEARNLIAAGFPDQQMEDFIRHVCEWGGYKGIAGRVLNPKNNTLSEIQCQFRNAMNALTSENVPDIRAALCEIGRIKHLGLSFASKHLRFLQPDLCPVLDSVLSEKLDYPLDVCGYKQFSDDCLRIAEALQQDSVSNPVGRDHGAWFAADVEMALFAHVNYQMSRS
jgi:hypothetical protein